MTRESNDIKLSNVSCNYHMNELLIVKQSNMFFTEREKASELGTSTWVMHIKSKTVWYIKYIALTSMCMFSI